MTGAETVHREQHQRLMDARAALARGDVISAYDLATEEGTTDDPDLAYIEVRALAAMGDWQSGLARYAATGLEQRDDTDFRALKGRLLKDAGRLTEASEAYAAAWRGPQDFYAAINAAATAFLAGDRAAAIPHARAALEGARAAAPDYWSLATQAEALILLDRPAAAQAMLAQAAACPDVGVAARATTYRQLSLLTRTTGRAIDLEPIRPPRTLHFCGHIFCEDPETEARIGKSARAVLREEHVGWAFGALAAGADIVMAEACLAEGVELHVVLPFDEADFIAASVLRGGPGWLARYDACMAGAARVHRASAMRFVQDDHQFAFGSAVAMGLARLRARQVGSEALQLAVWDGGAATGAAGTAPDVDLWRANGGRCRIIDGAGLPRPRAGQPGDVMARSVVPPGPADARRLRVLAFTDFKGFSQLPEASIPVFWRSVIGGAADVLEGASAHLTCRNTWGDALYLAFDDVPAAAEALVCLGDAMARLDLAALGLPPNGGMRIAAHYGAVYEMPDPVTRGINYCGSEVSRAARVEPVTPPGQVWVTEPLAAAIEMSAPASFACRYVGRIALAKGYGTERIYRLERGGEQSAL